MYFGLPRGCISGTDRLCGKLQHHQGTNISSSTFTKKTKHMIFVGGLPPNLDSETLRGVFQKQFGTVEDAIVIGNQEGDQFFSSGFGFITFKSEESVVAAVEVHYINLWGKRVEIERIVPRPSSLKMQSHTVCCDFFSPRFGFIFITESRSARRGPVGLVSWDDKHQKFVVFGGFFVLIAGSSGNGLEILRRAKLQVIREKFRNVEKVVESIVSHARQVCLERSIVEYDNEFIVGSEIMNHDKTAYLEPFLATIGKNLIGSCSIVASIGSGKNVALNLLNSVTDWGDLEDAEMILTRLVMACADAIIQVDNCGGPLEYVMGKVENQKSKIEHDLIMAEYYLEKRGINSNWKSPRGEFSPYQYSDSWDVLLTIRHLIQGMQIEYDKIFIQGDFSI